MTPLDAQNLLVRWSPAFDRRFRIPILAAILMGGVALVTWGLSESDSIRRGVEWGALALSPAWLGWTWRWASRPLHVLSVDALELETSPYGETPAARDYYVKFTVRAAFVGSARHCVEVVDRKRFPRAAQVNAQLYGILLRETTFWLVLDHALRPLGIELSDGRRFPL